MNNLNPEMIKYPQLNFHFFLVIYIMPHVSIEYGWLCENIYLFYENLCAETDVTNPIQKIISIEFYCM